MLPASGRKTTLGVDRGAAEIVGGVCRRRGWSDENKLRFVAETYERGTSVSAVARRHDPSPGLLFTWKQMAEGRHPRAAEPVAMLPVRMAEGPMGARGRPPRAARMEIGLPGGSRLKVDAALNPPALAAVIAVLLRR